MEMTTVTQATFVLPIPVTPAEFLEFPKPIRIMTRLITFSRWDAATKKTSLVFMGAGKLIDGSLDKKLLYVLTNRTALHDRDPLWFCTSLYEEVCRHHQNAMLSIQTLVDLEERKPFLELQRVRPDTDYPRLHEITHIIIDFLEVSDVAARMLEDTIARHSKLMTQLCTDVRNMNG